LGGLSRGWSESQFVWVVEVSRLEAERLDV
jgi:hypothetical protein